MGAIEMNWMGIEPDLLFEPYVTMQVYVLRYVMFYEYVF